MVLSLIGLITVWKLLDITVSIVAPFVLPYAGFFSYGDQMFKYNLPDFIRKLSNFDGIFFVRIATQGYSYTEQAYFPLYPLAISLVNYLINNPIVSAIIISHVAFVIGIVIFSKYLPYLTKKKDMLWFFLALLAYPTSYYFGVMYTESLFFMLFISTLYAYKKEKYILASTLAYATSLTRVTGVFVAVPLVVATLFQENKLVKLEKKVLSAYLRKHWRNVCVICSPFIGLATYCTYLWYTVGDPLFFIRAQESFGAQRSSHFIIPIQVIYRYIRILFTADLSFQYYVAMLELFFFLCAVSILVFDLYKQIREKSFTPDRLGLNIFSWINIIIPSMTGTLTALPRYTFMSLSLILVFGELKSLKMKYVWLIISIIMHIIMFSLFIQGYYVT